MALTSFNIQRRHVYGGVEIAQIRPLSTPPAPLVVCPSPVWCLVWGCPWTCPPLRPGRRAPGRGLANLVGALACPLAAGAGAVPGGVQLVGNLRP